MQVRWTGVSKHVFPEKIGKLFVNINTGPTSIPNITTAIIHPSYVLAFALFSFMVHLLCVRKNVTAPLKQCQHSHCLVWECKEGQAPRTQRGGATREH